MKTKTRWGVVKKKYTKHLMDGNKRQMLMTANLAQLLLWLVLKC